MGNAPLKTELFCLSGSLLPDPKQTFSPAHLLISGLIHSGSFQSLLETQASLLWLKSISGSTFPLGPTMAYWSLWPHLLCDPLFLDLVTQLL